MQQLRHPTRAQGRKCGQSGNQQAGSLGRGWQLLIRAARDSSIVRGGSAALAGQDRRGEVSAPVELHTAAYQLRYGRGYLGKRHRPGWSWSGGRIWTDCTNRVNGCGVDRRWPGADLSRPRRQDAQTPRETGAPAPLGVAAYSVLSSWVGSLTLMEVIL